MAKSKLQGITLEIGGDTTALSKALKKPNTEAYELQGKLKAVNQALKVDPTNIELLAQKQRVLGEAVDKNKEKLNMLKEAQQQFIDSGKNIDSAEYIELERQIKNTEQTIKRLSEQQNVFSEKVQAFGIKAEKMGTNLENAGKKLTPLSIGLAGVGGAATKVAINFEDAMSQAAGALDIPVGKMNDLRELAIQVGQDTIFSASEAGQAMTELAKGGLSAADIKGGALVATMDLAASSQMDLANSANVVVQAMGAFGLTAEDVSVAVNALAGAAAASSTDVEPLTQGLAQCSAQANNAGWSIQETTAVLGKFADAGIVGSDAGTSLKTMLQRLAAPSSDKAAEKIEQLGIKTRDSSGEMLGATEIAQELQNKLGGLDAATRDAALQTIFGSDAMRAATVLMNSGAEGLKKYTDATNDQEAASRLADSQMSEYSRAIEEMKGSIETAAIAIGGTLAPIVSDVAKVITELVNKFSALSPATQKVITVVGLIVAALAPVLIIAGKTAQGISNIINLGTKLGPSFTKASGIIKSAFGSIGKAVSGAFSAITAHPVIAAITAIIAVVVLLYTKCEWFRDAVNGVIKSVVNFFQGLVDSIALFFTETIPQKIEEFVAFFQSIPERIGEFVNGIVTWFNELPYKIGFAVGQIVGHMVQWGINLSNFMTITVPQFINGIVTWFSQLPGKIWEWLVNAWNNVIQWGTNTYNSAVEWISKTVDGIINYFSQLPEKMWNWLSNAANKIVQWGLELWNKGKDAAGKLVSAVVEGVSSLPGKMLDIGKNIVEGIWNGITGMGNWLKDKIFSFADGFLGGLMSAFGIHSPSRLMRDLIGKNLAAGIGVGIEENSELALKPLSQLQREMTSSFTPDVNATVSRALSMDSKAVIEIHNTVPLDGKPIYQNIERRMTKVQHSKLVFKGV